MIVLAHRGLMLPATFFNKTNTTPPKKIEFRPYEKLNTLINQLEKSIADEEVDAGIVTKIFEATKTFRPESCMREQRQLLLTNAIRTGNIDVVRAVMERLSPFKVELANAHLRNPMSSHPIYWETAVMIPAPFKDYQAIEKYLCEVLDAPDKTYINGVKITRDQFVNMYNQQSANIESSAIKVAQEWEEWEQRRTSKPSM